MPTPKKPKRPAKKPASTQPQPKRTPPALAWPAMLPCDHDDCPRTHCGRAKQAQSGHVCAGDLMPEAEAVRTYLDELERCGQYLAAAAVTGRHFTFFWRRRRADPAFAAAEAEALSLAPDMLRSELARRAVEGSVRMTKYGSHIEYDNALALRYAEYLETGSWRQRQQVETGGPGAFKTRAEAEEALRSRREELAKAESEIAAEEARDAEAATAARPHNSAM